MAPQARRFFRCTHHPNQHPSGAAGYSRAKSLKDSAHWRNEHPGESFTTRIDCFEVDENGARLGARPVVPAPPPAPALPAALPPPPPAALPPPPPAALPSLTEQFAALQIATMTTPAERASSRTKVESAKARENNTSSSAQAPQAKQKDVNPLAKLPARYIPPPDNPKYRELPKPLGAKYTFSKTSNIDGETIDFEMPEDHPTLKVGLGYRYERCAQNPDTGYFHTVDVAPYGARLSIEDGPILQTDVHGALYYSKDRDAVTSEFGYTCISSNVCAREGSYYYEAKLVSSLIPERDRVLAKDKPEQMNHTGRGGVRVGFARREQDPNINVGSWGYSYALSSLDGLGLSAGARLSEAKFDRANEGDIVGLIITLPPLDLHQTVVNGSYHKAIHIEGVAPVPGAIAPQAGTTGKAKKNKKDKKGKDKAPAGTSVEAPADPDPFEKYIPNIIRDRQPLLFKGHAYFECTNYTPLPGLKSLLDSKGIRDSSGQLINHTVEGTPYSEHVLHRTLPDSKIEIFINGKFQGVIAEGLKCFLPGASTTAPEDKVRPRGHWDDGGLGYYPAVSVLYGGAVQCKFDGPGWYGPPKDRPEVKWIGERYNEQAIDDGLADMVDEIEWERNATAMAPAPAPEAQETNDA